MKINEQVLRVAWDLKKCMFPAKPTTANLAAYRTLSVNMMMIDCVRQFSPDLNVTDTINQLAKFVKELGLGMNADIAAKSALGKNEMEVCL